MSLTVSYPRAEGSIYLPLPLLNKNTLIDSSHQMLQGVSSRFKYSPLQVGCPEAKVDRWGLGGDLYGEIEVC